MADNINLVSATVPNTPIGAHSNHGGAATSFGAVLSQAVGQVQNASHGSHSAASAGSFGLSKLPQEGERSISGDRHQPHFPISGQKHREGHGLQAMALGIRACRQQLLASNIANADTPGYKAVDIDFAEVMRMAQVQGPSIALAATAPGHLAGSASAQPIPLKYHVPTQASADGNTVDMDVERSKLAENTTMYSFSLDRVSGHFKMMGELFRDMKP